MRAVLFITLTLVRGVCCQAAELHVAAAANLYNVLPNLDSVFEHQSGIHVVPSFGATAQLTQQIENGAPFDIFLSADTEHIDRLIKSGFVVPDTRAIYARGELAIWAPHEPGLHTLEDLAEPAVHAIAVAKPELAPYGAAAIETLKNAGLWEKVQRKIVYAPSVAIAKQFADTGNADAAFTARALTVGQPGHAIAVPEKLHSPIDQALGMVKDSKQQKDARAFAAFLAGPAARMILQRFGYTQP